MPFWTIPFELDSDVIGVNARTLYSGGLRCQIFSAGLGNTGGEVRFIEEIEGFTLDDCEPICGDHVDATLTWNGVSDVSHLGDGRCDCGSTCTKPTSTPSASDVSPTPAPLAPVRLRGSRGRSR